MIIPTVESDTKRLLAKIKQGNDCWEWTASLRATGYGQITINRKSVLAHRAMWMRFVGPIPEGMGVLHKCDNPKCVKIEHLFLGTHQENMDDMARKGRRSHSSLRGSKNPHAIINEDQVRLIKMGLKSCLKRGDMRKLALKLRIKYHLIKNIKHGNSWKHVVIE